MSTQTITYTYSASNDANLSGSIAQTGDGSFSLTIALPTPTTNQEVDVSWTNTNLKSLFMLSDQTVTVKSNSSGAPDNTVTVTANVPAVFQASSGQTNPFLAANVVKLYVTNASGTAATLQLRILVDSTP